MSTKGERRVAKRPALSSERSSSAARVAAAGESPRLGVREKDTACKRSGREPG
jgi:hypothetical protein